MGEVAWARQLRGGRRSGCIAHFDRSPRTISPVLLTAQLATAPTLATGAGFQDGSGPHEGAEVPVAGPASAPKSPKRRAVNMLAVLSGGFFEPCVSSSAKREYEERTVLSPWSLVRPLLPHR